MNMQFFSPKLRTSFFLKLQVSTAMMAFLAPLEGWAMDDPFDTAPHSVVTQKSVVNKEEGEDTPSINQVNVQENLRNHKLEDIPEYMQSTFKSAINDIPQLERAKFLTSMVSALEGVDYYDKRNILEASINVPPDERADVLAKAAPLMKGIRFASDRVKLIRLVKETSKDERTLFSTSMALALEGFDTAYVVNNYRLSIIDEVENVPATERTDVLAKAAPILKNIPHHTTRALFLSTIKDISQIERAEFLRNMPLALEGVDDEDGQYWIIHEFSKVPATERANVLAKAAPVMKYFPFVAYRILLISAIKDIPQIDRTEFFVKNVVAIINGITDGYTSHAMEAVQAVPPNERADVLAKAAPLLKDIPSGLARASLIYVIYKTPREGRDEFLVNLTLALQGIIIAPVKEGYTDDSKRVLINALLDIPQNERNDVLVKAIPFLKGFTDPRDRISLIQTIKSIPRNERADVLEKAKPFLKDASGHKIDNLILAVTNIPRDERTDVLEKAEPLLKGIPNGGICNRLIFAIKDIPQVKRAEFLTDLTSALGGINDESQESIVYMLDKVSQPERVKFLNKLASVLKSIPSGKERATLISIMRWCTPKVDLVRFLTSISSALEGIKDDTASDVIQAVESIPLTDVTKFLEKLAPFLRDIPNGKARAALITTIHEIPQKQREDVLTKTKLFLQNTPEGKGRADLIYAIYEIPKNEREDVIKKVKLFLKDISVGKGLGILILVCGESSQTKRDEFLLNVKPLLQDIPTPEGRASIIGLLDLTPITLRTQTIDFLKNAMKKDHDNFELALKEGIGSCFHFLFNLDGDFKKKMINKWTSILSSSDDTKMLSLSAFIIENVEELGFSDEDQIVQDAMRLSETQETDTEESSETD